MDMLDELTEAFKTYQETRTMWLIFEAGDDEYEKTKRTFLDKAESNFPELIRLARAGRDGARLP